MISNKYNIGDTVYLKTDKDQLPRLITSITIYPNNNFTYLLSCGVDSTWHYEMEVSDVRDIMFLTDN